MPQYNVTLEDISPLITYSPPGAWADSNQGDALHAQYSGDSFHATAAPGASFQVAMVPFASFQRTRA
jgi:hypothetical protein